MALLLGGSVAVVVTPPLATRGERRLRGARRLLHAAARRLRGDPRLRLPDHARPAAARPARLPAAGADRPGAGGAAARRAHGRAGARRRSTTGSGRPPRRWAPGRCARCSPSTCRWCGGRCWPPPGSRSRSRWASSAPPPSSPATTHPTLPVVIFRLHRPPGRANYGMALAASVVLAATTALVDARRRAAARAGPWERSDARRSRDVSVRYDGVPAVARRVARPARRRGARRARPVRLRQVDAAARGRRAGAGHRPAASRGTAPTSPAYRPTSAGSR